MVLFFQARANVEKEFNDKIIQNYTEIIEYILFRKEGMTLEYFMILLGIKKKKIIIKRDNQNLPIIRFSLFNKDIQPGISVKKYNDKDLSQTSDEEIKNFI